jgi:Bacterial SH3 domain
MTDAATLRSWLEGLGLEVKEAGTSGDQLSVMPTDDGDPGVAVQRSDPATWEVVHDRRVEQSVLSSDWHAPWDTEPPAVVVNQAAREVAYGFPLVESETHDEGGDVAVRFRAPVFDEGLTRQGFVLTVSSVLKVAQVFDLVLTRRADELAAWKEFEANSEQREQEQEELIDRMTEAPAAPEATTPVAPVPQKASTADTVPAVAWSPTHAVKRRVNAWAQPDPAGARAGTLARRIPVQVVERQGDWARVVTSNGWSGWIDSRDLKAR